MMEALWDRRSGRPRHDRDARSADELDYARVVHAGSFRRLQGKTQILSLGDDDFYRTRLTHSLEVAQVAEGLLQYLSATVSEEVRRWLPPSALIRAIGLAHDIGHPPFGHGGELALNYCMRDAGGFEGNGQTLRLLTRLEAYSVEHGADLSRRTLLGLLKYPTLASQARNRSDPGLRPRLIEGPTTIAALDHRSASPVKACFDSEADVLAWVLAPFIKSDREAFQAVSWEAGKHGKTLHKSFDCSIMDEADNIAYGVHDLEDAIALGLIDAEEFQEGVSDALVEELLVSLSERPIDGAEASYEGLIAGLFGSPGPRKRVIGRLVHHCIAGAEVAIMEEFETPLLRYRLRLRDRPRVLLKALRDLISDKVIRSPRVQHLDFKGQRMVLACFEALVSSPEDLLPSVTHKAYVAADGDARIICDYLACLTDGGLLRLYDRLFSPRMGTIFDRL